jgi:hypothetical protein
LHKNEEAREMLTEDWVHAFEIRDHEGFCEDWMEAYK